MRVHPPCGEAEAQWRGVAPNREEHQASRHCDDGAIHHHPPRAQLRGHVPNREGSGDQPPRRFPRERQLRVQHPHEGVEAQLRSAAPNRENFHSWVNQGDGAHWPRPQRAQLRSHAPHWEGSTDQPQSFLPPLRLLRRPARGRMRGPLYRTSRPPAPGQLLLQRHQPRRPTARVQCRPPHQLRRPRPWSPQTPPREHPRAVTAAA